MLRRDHLLGLTDREQQITNLVCEGLSNKAIAHRLGLCEGTVKLHLHHIRNLALPAGTHWCRLRGRTTIDPKQQGCSEIDEDGPNRRFHGDTVSVFVAAPTTGMETPVAEVKLRSPIPIG